MADTATTLIEEIIEAHGGRILWDTLRIPTQRRVRPVFFDRPECADPCDEKDS